MNKFPCSTCLIKACCSQYCTTLEQNPRIIDIYVASLKQCPDCGSILNLGSTFNKTHCICFECSKVFRQDTFVKRRGPLSDMIGDTGRLINFSITKVHIGQNRSIITDLSDKVEPIPFSMEETHDVLYNRVSLKESRLILKILIQEVRETLVKKPQPPPLTWEPSWINEFKPILLDEYNFSDANVKIIF